MSKDNPSILITGNAGYVGPLVVREVLTRYPNASVTGVDSGYFAHCLTGVDFLPERRVHVQRFADLRDFEQQWLQSVDAVVHLAAISNDPMGRAFESATRAINADASGRIARLAKSAGVRHFVFASSCSIYGESGDLPKAEGAPLNPLTAYAESKIDVENTLAELASDDFVVTCLRFATACGWSPRTRLDLVLNDFVASALSTGKIEVLSDGTPWRPLIHVDDMSRALVWAMFRDREGSGSYVAVNVGSNRWVYRIRDLAEAVADLIPGTQVRINRDAAPDKRSYTVDFSLLSKIAPHDLIRWDLPAAVRELQDNLESAGVLDTDFRNSRYIRLNELTRLQRSGALTQELRWK